MKLRTWHMEAAAQSLLYLGAIYGQFGTLWRGELLLAAGLWLLGRVGSRADRQREQYDRTGVAAVMAQHAVECAAGTKVDLRLASVAFGLWGLTIGSWLTLADVAWTLGYPLWRRLYRRATAPVVKSELRAEILEAPTTATYALIARTDRLWLGSNSASDLAGEPTAEDTAKSGGFRAADGSAPVSASVFGPLREGFANDPDVGWFQPCSKCGRPASIGQRCSNCGT